MPNKPSYSNLGGSGRRASVAFSATGTFTAGGASSASITVTNAFLASASGAIPADAGARIMHLTWTGGEAYALLATVPDTGHITVSTPYFVSGSSFPASGSVTVASGGPFLISAALSSGTAWAYITHDGGSTTAAGDPNVLLGGVNWGETGGGGNGLIFQTSGAGAVTLNGQYISFDFGYQFQNSLSPAKIISEVSIDVYTYNNVNNGTWRIDASNDPTWTTGVVTVSGNFALAAAATGFGTVVVPLTTAAGYRYYRMYGVSGTTQAAGYASVIQIRFKIDDWAAATPALDASNIAAADTQKFYAIDETLHIGTSPASPAFPPGIIYQDDFSAIDANQTTGWADIATAALTLDLDHVRTGTVSISAACSSVVPRIGRIFPKPLNLTNASVVLQWAITSPPSDGVGQLRMLLLLTDAAGKQYTDSFISGSVFVGDPETWTTGWMPRLAIALCPQSRDANGGVGGDASFDITDVVSIELRPTDGGNNSFTITLDSLTFLSSPSAPQIMYRCDPQNGVSGLMLADYLHANVPSAKCTFATAPGYNGQGGLSGSTDSTTGVGPSGTGYGALASAYLAAQQHGHRVMDWFDFRNIIAADYPLSPYSAVGLCQWNRYWFEGLGFNNQAMRVTAPGSGSMAFAPKRYAAMRPHMDTWLQAYDDTSGNQSQLINDFVYGSDDAATAVPGSVGIGPIVYVSDTSSIGNGATVQLYWSAAGVVYMAQGTAGSIVSNTRFNLSAVTFPWASNGVPATVLSTLPWCLVVVTDVVAPMKHSMAANGRFVLFSHCQDLGATTGWGASSNGTVNGVTIAGNTATSNNLGFGAGWDFHPGDRPDLYTVMCVFARGVIPALKGTLFSGQNPAKMITAAQLANSGITAGGGGGPGRLSLGGL